MKRVTGGEGFLTILGIIIVLIFRPGWIIPIILLGVFIAIVIMLICYFLPDKRPACPSCGSKVGKMFLHSRHDGGPDGRYRYNPLVCAGCGKTTDELNLIAGQQKN